MQLDQEVDAAALNLAVDDRAKDSSGNSGEGAGPL